MNPRQRGSDEELLARIADGDPQVAIDFAGAHLGDAYDFALRLTLDASLARAAVLEAAGRLLADPAPGADAVAPRSRLLGLVREEGLARLRGRSRPEVARDLDARGLVSPLEAGFTTLSAISPFAGAEAGVAAWAWQAARSQRPTDYALLDLALRRGLAAEEIAALTGRARGSLYTSLGRVRGALEEGFAVPLLFARGGDACPELRSLIGDAIQPSPGLRRQIVRHAETCDACRATLAAYPSAGDLLAAFAAVHPPPALAAQATQRIVAAVAPVSKETATREEADNDNALTAGVLAAAPEQESAPSTLVAADEDKGLTPVEQAVAAGFMVAVTAFAADAALVPVAAPPAVPPRGGRGAALGWFGEGGRRRYVFAALFAAVTLLAVYLGAVFGASIEDGGGSSGPVAPLPTRSAAVPAISCGTPISVDQGDATTLTFQSASLPAGFRVAEIVILPRAGANPTGVKATPKDGLVVLLEAQTSPGAPGRTEEYRMQLLFSRDQERVQSECAVLIRAPLASAPSATPPPPPPAPTGTPLPPPTQPPPPTPANTAVPPTATVPAGLTATSTLPPPTSTSTATATVTPSPTPTRTPVP